ncbi:SDR family oxidoreductase [Lewinella sp. IMCC34183]|uniref:SDR family oxidoreductase n=1 Tax=Lewinella sp. IMCC34183 TaxID=2248762 RepID=UPI000E276E54|nr:SDR family oxidoreductase [Lewinella sp. IMCC34183]
MILVTGATGDIGGKLCGLLYDHQVPFRAMCRKQAQIDQFIRKGIEAVLGDFERPETLTGCMQGCDRLFLITPPDPRQVRWEKDAIDAAVRTGIHRIVKVSASDANLGSVVPWAKSHATIDHYLRGADIAWTILKPTAFMQNFLSLAKSVSKGFLPQVAGKGKVGYIDTTDVARVAHRVLVEDDHAGATYFLTGPEVLTMGEIAGQLSDALGRKVRYLNLPSSVFRIILRLSGLSKWFAQGLVVQFADVVAGGHAMDLNGEVRRLTKHKPLSFADFAREHREALNGNG